jgi:hypothetical protein
MPHPSDGIAMLFGISVLDIREAADEQPVGYTVEVTRAGVLP